MKKVDKPLFIILAEQQSEFGFPIIVFIISLSALVGIGYAGYKAYYLPENEVCFIIYLLIIGICFGFILYCSIKLFINAMRLKSLLKQREKLSN